MQLASLGFKNFNIVNMPGNLTEVYRACLDFDQLAYDETATIFCRDNK